MENNKKMNWKNFLKITNNKMIILTIFLGAAFVGFTTGNVIAQEVKIGDTSGTPFVSFEDAMASGMYEIRLNDGTGEFEIRDMTNNRTSLIVGSNGNVGVGDAGSTAQDFVIGCTTGLCNIQTRAFDGDAQNTVRTFAGGNAKIRLWDDETNKGSVTFDIITRNDGTVCMGDGAGEKCFLIFDLKGNNPGQVRQTDGTCIANC